jgi:hypothetical protein
MSQDPPPPGRLLLRSQFRVVADAVCRPGATKDSGATKKEENKELLKSSAQVDLEVAPRGRASAAPKQGKRLHPLGVRFSEAELEVVKRKARNAGCTVNGYIRASALGSNYKVPVHQELRLTLLASNRELTALGRNINQIARQLNSGASPQAILSQQPLRSIQTAVLETLAIVRAALAGRQQP